MTTTPTLHPFDATDITRLGILSDSHGVIDSELLKRLARCDVWIHAGDVGSDDVMESLSNKRFVAVRGNNDTMAKWPNVGRYPLHDAVKIQLQDGFMVVIHGHQFPNARTRHARLRALFPDALAVIYGHSHRLVTDCEQRPWILNPGASGRARTFGGPSALVLSRTSRRPWRLEIVRVAKA